jgi:predicted O-methyltransferase YrrM
MFQSITSRMKGSWFTLPNNWFVLVNPDEFQVKPIQYLEIGAHCGVNAICVAASYARHPDSKLYAIDPWQNYSEYPEYKDSQNAIYEAFQHNINVFQDIKQKITPIKGFSHEAIHQFSDNFFDILYVDGNHQPEYVLEDGVLSFRKLKPGGVMIFDDYNYGGLDCTKRGVDAFLTAYRDRIQYLGFYGGQIFLRKNKV